MYLQLPAGSTSKIIQIPVYDSASTVGALLAGLAFGTASLTAYYNREGAAGAATVISLVTATKGTWTSSGFIAVDGTNQPGVYELHVPNAALAAGAKSVVIYLKGAADMVPAVVIIELTATSNQDAEAGGMAAITRTAGLVMENHVEDDIVRDGNGMKTSSVIYIYDSAANATTHDKATGLTASYTVAVTYNRSKMAQLKVVKN